MDLFKIGLLLGFITACTQPTSPLGRTAATELFQIWSLLNADEAGALLNDPQGDITYAFFRTGEVTRFENTRYSAGTWRLTGAEQIEIDFGPGERGSGVFNLAKLDKQYLTLEPAATVRQQKGLFFVTTGRKHEEAENNPFHLSTNLWRVRPARRETDAELRARLKNHVAHYAAIIESALFNATNAITFKNAPSCLQIYRSALAVRPLEQADPGWTECFFDRQDAEKATEMMRTAVKKHEKSTTKSKMWAKDVLALLREVEGELE